MKTTEPIEARPVPRGACRKTSGWLHASAAAVPLLGLASACLAVDSMSGLGSVFRPGGGADPSPGAGKFERPAANPPGLRVLVSRASRPVASIDGQIVHVGDTVHGMRVTRIDAQGVVLQGEDGASESLSVTPSVVKRSRLPEATHNSKGNRP